MAGVHPLKNLLDERRSGKHTGICSVCSANEYVLEAAMERARQVGQPVLIESTSNQVNQFGGYTGMTPKDFVAFVHEIAGRIGFPTGSIILGGDHLGPVPFKNEASGPALEKSREMVRQYVMAGYTKIHLDTSMLLGDDPVHLPLETATIAERGAVLCSAAEEAYAELLSVRPEAIHPVYVIGSEVPIPGGSQEKEDSLKVTGVSDFEDTVARFKAAFEKQGLSEAWDHVVAVVVQPGVEFGDDVIHAYSREKAQDLKEALREHPGLVFEGHSTDYQTAQSLREMVEDGIAILKVGPALTFALREALIALEHMERDLLQDASGTELSNFMETLDAVMREDPKHWQKYYHGNEASVRLARKYSFSDRCRYYLPYREVKAALGKLLGNLRSVDIPLTLLSQYMPIQYGKVRSGRLAIEPEALLKDRVVNLLDDYYHATMPRKHA